MKIKEIKNKRFITKKGDIKILYEKKKSGESSNKSTQNK